MDPRACAIPPPDGIVDRPALGIWLIPPPPVRLGALPMLPRPVDVEPRGSVHVRSPRAVFARLGSVRLEEPDRLLPERTIDGAWKLPLARDPEIDGDADLIQLAPPDSRHIPAPDGAAKLLGSAKLWLDRQLGAGLGAVRIDSRERSAGGAENVRPPPIPDGAAILGAENIPPPPIPDGAAALGAEDDRSLKDPPTEEPKPPNERPPPTEPELPNDRPPPIPPPR